MGPQARRHNHPKSPPAIMPIGEMTSPIRAGNGSPGGRSETIMPSVKALRWLLNKARFASFDCGRV